MAISSGSQVQEEQSQAGLGSGLSALFSTQVLSPESAEAEFVTCQEICVWGWKAEVPPHCSTLCTRAWLCWG